MCTIPPAPPPPLLPTANSIQPGSRKNIDKVCYDNNLCQWAVDSTELREACIKNNICVFKDPFKYKYRYLESIQQVGPTCGIVALSMLLNGNLSADKILRIAKDLGYTNNGEMFSCKQLAELAKQVFELINVDKVIINVKIGGLYSEEIVKRLLDGAFLLVPYDADCNHSPCLKNGHTAHWAVICGVIITKDRDFDVDPLNIHVFAKHGKSKYLAIWKLEELERSNANLMEFSPKKKADDLVYVLPEGGVGGENGLKNQFLIVEGLSL